MSYIRFQSSQLAKRYISRVFVGSLTKNGNKTRAINLFNQFLLDIQYKFKTNPIDFLDGVIGAIRPKVFLISKKISGSTVKIPTPITVKRSYSIAIKWLLSSALKRRGAKLSQQLFSELLDICANSTNGTIRKRDEYHKLAKINRTFLRYNKF
jgi:small subunit ribosomal protein S7